MKHFIAILLIGFSLWFPASAQSPNKDEVVQLPCSEFDPELEKINQDLAIRGYRKQEDVLVSVFDREGELHIYTDLQQRIGHAVLVMPNGCTFHYLVVDRMGKKAWE